MKQKTKFKQTEIGMIPEDWEIVSLDELYEISSGLSKPREEFGYGYPFLDYKTIFSKNKVPDQLRSLVNSTLNEREKCSIKRGDVFLTRTSENTEELGLSCVALKDYKDATFNGFAKRLRSKKEKILPEFSVYLFRSKATNAQMTVQASMTTRSSLNSSMIRIVKLICPPLSEQSAIAKILSDLDSKIELSQQMNKTLEAIGQAIFKRWFVDFEFPNEKGKPYKSSGGEMVESELGEIPKGWKIGKLGDLGKIQPGFAFKSKDFLDDGIGLAKIKNIQPPIVDFNFESYISEELYNKTNDRFYLFSGDILIAMTGAKIGKIGIISKTENKISLNQRVGKVESNNKYLMYLILNTNEIQGLISGGSSASSAQGNISNSDIENFIYIIPNEIFLQKINKMMNCLFVKMIDNLGEIQNLSQIRDSLLPRLMSGKIRVPVEVRT